ncbi:dynein light chain Tctex-type protein 2B-like isoform X2 [Chrysoperla carnea]|uniref:dynein light chain Tctex-type protein 2B-like isoform X2 n=1 Tax=Chrysoperla carnea TaxID=189513 RepID=UPI001D066BB4|nr:dynein light chain Tctex-type protein 2B-like isoform X2 [Chrysoperla carnea]
MSVQSSITGEQISTLDEEVESTYEAKALPSSQEVAPSTYLIKPPLSQKFRAQPVQLIIKTILRDMLTGVEYSQEGAKELTKKIANEIRDKVRGYIILYGSGVCSIFLLIYGMSIWFSNLWYDNGTKFKI